MEHFMMEHEFITTILNIDDNKLINIFVYSLIAYNKFSWEQLGLSYFFELRIIIFTNLIFDLSEHLRFTHFFIIFIT